MKLLVAYASKAGSTKGIAEFVGERLRGHGLQVDVKEVSSIRDVGSYDAYVVGSAVYMFHWMKEAKQFLSRNKEVLAGKPVWLFSSGPVGKSRTNAKGQDLLDVAVSGPKEFDELAVLVRPRGHKIFFGVLDASKLTGATGFMYRMARRSEAAKESMSEGDFRDWKEIEAWADGIAEALRLAPTP
jgi:menaquinone-dependent protoporphyrinogen oxidase